MLRKQVDGLPVGDWVGLRQVFHGFHEESLAVNVARVRITLAAPTAHFGRNRNGENLGHEHHIFEQRDFPLHGLGLQ
jgi:hypothetical protein